MFGSQVLEVAIGVVLLYLLLSLICSSIREGIEAWVKTRAADLERGIRELLSDPEGNALAQAVYTHPLIYGLFQGGYTPGKRGTLLPRGGNLPSYIPAGNFAVALMDVVARGAVAPASGPTGRSGPAPAGETRLSLQSLRAAAERLDNASVRRALLSAIDTSQNDLGRAQANLEAWFNSSMDRVSGWYKRRTQNIIFVIGLALTIALNADTVKVATSLVQDEALRRVVVAEAEIVARDKDRSAAEVSARYQDVKSLGFPIGWQGWPGARAAAGHIPGWLMTAFAIALGAPFWFDVLNKFMVVRSTVKPREKSQEEGSEDRAPRTGTVVVDGRATAGSGLAAATLDTPPGHEWARGNPREGVL
jgi:hypothetical protein